VTDAVGVDIDSIKLYINGYRVDCDITAIPGGYNVSYWHEAGFSEGEIITCRIVADDICGNHLDFTWTFTIGVISDTFDISLSPGWNFISFPLVQSNTSILAVLASIDGQWDLVKYYDTTDPADPWKTYGTYKPASLNDLLALDHTMGFWIRSTGNCTLQINGELPSYTNITLKAGWNMVGYSSLTERTISEALNGTGYDCVEGFNASDPELISELDDSYLMRPGEGYLVHVPVDTVWTMDW